MKILFSFSFFIFWLATAAQTFTVNEVDASAFPNITFSINSTIAIEQNEVSILDNDQAVPSFQWVAVNNEVSNNNSTNQAICFLIDASAFVNNSQMAFLKKAIKNYLLADGNVTLVNIAFYQRSNSVEMIRRLSTEFTADYASLSKDLETKIFVAQDKNPVVDFYKVLHECINFIGNKSTLPTNKKIILISTGNNNGTSAFKITECVENAKEKGIIVDAIGLSSNTINAIDNCKLIAEKTNGNYSYAKNDNDINLFLNRNEKKNKTVIISTDSSFNYTVTYKSLVASSKDSVLAKVSIDKTYKEFTYAIGAVNGVAKTKGINNLYFLFAIGAGVIILLVILFFLYIQKKKKIAEALTQQQATMQAQHQREARAVEEKLLTTKIDIIKPDVQAPQKPSPPSAQEPQNNKTTIAGVKVPRITIYINGAANFYELKNAQYYLGRNASNDIAINDSTVSSSHATITIENGLVFLTDNNSTNGSFVNNIKIQKQQLTSGDTITLGQIEIKYTS